MRYRDLQGTFSAGIVPQIPPFVDGEFIPLRNGKFLSGEGGCELPSPSAGAKMGKNPKTDAEKN
jgi:hypothetical protein